PLVDAVERVDSAPAQGVEPVATVEHFRDHPSDGVADVVPERCRGVEALHGPLAETENPPTNRRRGEVIGGVIALLVEHDALCRFTRQNPRARPCSWPLATGTRDVAPHPTSIRIRLGVH